MTKNDHFETQKCHFSSFLASFKISFSSLQHPSHNLWHIICLWYFSNHSDISIFVIINVFCNYRLITSPVISKLISKTEFEKYLLRRCKLHVVKRDKYRVMVKLEKNRQLWSGVIIYDSSNERITRKSKFRKRLKTLILYQKIIFF